MKHASVRIQDAQFSVAKSSGIRNYVDLNDPVMPERQAKCQSQLMTERHDQSHIAIHKSDMRELRKTGVGEGFSGNILSTMSFDRTTRRQGVRIRPTDHGRVEYRDQRTQIAGSRSREKGLHYFPLADSVSAAHRILTLHAMASTASQFLCRDRGSPDDCGNLVEWHSENVVKYKCQPLSRRQGVQDNQ